MRNSNYLVMAAVLLGIVGAAPSLRASELFAIANDLNGNTSFENLYHVSQTDGAATLVGATSVAGPRDLASDTRPGSFAMWTMEFSQRKLFSVDPATGATALVGALGPSDSEIKMLAFDTTTGTLYGLSELGFLYSINRNTAAATFIGFTGRFGVYVGLGCDNNGTLFGVLDDASGASDNDYIEVIDRTTGQAISSVKLGTLGITDIAVRPEDNVLFGVSSTTKSIYTINTTTGATTLLGPYGADVSNLEGLAFTAVPEAGSSAVAFFVLAIVTRRNTWTRA